MALATVEDFPLIYFDVRLSWANQLNPVRYLNAHSFEHKLEAILLLLPFLSVVNNHHLNFA